MMRTDRAFRPRVGDALEARLAPSQVIGAAAVATLHNVNFAQARSGTTHLRAVRYAMARQYVHHQQHKDIFTRFRDSFRSLLGLHHDPVLPKSLARAKANH